jgi:N utilization substance protein A
VNSYSEIEDIFLYYSDFILYAIIFMKLDGKAIQAAMMQLVEDYKFDPYQILEISKLGIKSGFKKDFPEYRKSDILVDIKEDGTVKIYKAMEVVEEVEDEDTQITLKEAKKIRGDAKIGEKLL